MSWRLFQDLADQVRDLVCMKCGSWRSDSPWSIPVMSTEFEEGVRDPVHVGVSRFDYLVVDWVDGTLLHLMRNHQHLIGGERRSDDHGTRVGIFDSHVGDTL